MMPLVYIAGPYRHRHAWGREQNIRAAERMGLKLANAGAVPVIPHTMYRHYDGTIEDAYWLDATMQILERCDAVVLCTGWRDSEGSRAEAKRAAELGIPVYEGWGTVPVDSITPRGGGRTNEH